MVTFGPIVEFAPLPTVTPVVAVETEPGVNADCFPLNVLQFAADNTPRFVEDAVGTFNVITGVVVGFVTVLVKSVPVVPKVIAATLVTVPPPPLPC